MLKKFELRELLDFVKNEGKVERSKLIDFANSLGLSQTAIYYLYDHGFLKKVKEGKLIFYMAVEKIFNDFSFGIEFEGNARNFKGIVNYCPEKYHTVGKWDYQMDGTVTFELRSPVWSDINEAFNDIHEEFSSWISANNNIVPFFRPTKYYNSVGGHIHVSLGKRHKLSPDEANSIIAKNVRFLPFLYFINANGVVGKYISRRMIEAPYSTLKFDEKLRTTREEFYLSPHGTVEWRRFDANIPAVQLAIAFLMKNITLKASEKPWNADTLQREVRACLKYPADLAYLLSIRQRFYEIADISISDLPNSIKEVLALCFVFLKNPSIFVGTFSYEFCQKSSLGLFLEGMKLKGEKLKIAKKIAEIINQAKTLGDLLNIGIIADRETEYLLRISNISIEFLKSLNINIARLDGDKQKNIIDKYLNNKAKKPPFIDKKEWKNIVFNYSCKKIFRLSELNLNDFIKLTAMVGKTRDEMIKATERYYVLKENNEIKGYAIVNAPNKTLIKWEGFDENDKKLFIETVLKPLGIIPEPKEVD